MPASPSATAPQIPHRSNALIWATRAALLASAAPLVWAAIRDHGLYWPDEIFQSLEQAHRLVFHYGMIPWEFEDGARSWVFPGALGLLWMAALALGVTNSWMLVTVAKLFIAGISLAGIDLGRRLATTLAGPRAGLVATLLLGSFPLSVVLGARPMTEAPSATLILAAAYFGAVAERPRPGLAGALASLAIFLRFQNGLVAAGLLVILLARDRRRARRYAAAGVAVALLGGGLDALTWSYPFQSFVVYLKFNLIDGRAAEMFGTSPWTFYPSALEAAVGASSGLLLAGLVLGSRQAFGLFCVVMLYLGLHLAIPHKELRFLLPILPLAVAISAVGLTSLCETHPWGGRLAVVLALGMAASQGIRARDATEQEYRVSPADDSLWHDEEGYMLLESLAGRSAKLCGIALVGQASFYTGGYTYLHKDVPLYFNLDHLENVNFVVGRDDEALDEPWHKVREKGGYALYRRPGECAPDPGYVLSP